MPGEGLEKIEEEERRPQVVLAGLECTAGGAAAGGSKAEAARSLRLEGSLGYDFDHSMEEMVSLVDACDMEVVCVLTQKLPHPEAGTYIGSGKIEELKELCRALSADLCVFEGNLTPAQLRNIQKEIDIPVWDRTTLILEIFSRRAGTREARLQVESAYLQYMLPRLSGMWEHLGRQSGGGGSRANKGLGETQLELDRRMIKHRIAELGRELDAVSGTREVQRSGREKGGLPGVALVGYTNAGKSTIMNRMLEGNDRDGEKFVLEKDMLFATLDTQIRRIGTEGNRDFLLSDTVGFIENLPHGLIKAFRSTLEEAVKADLLLIVLDVSSPYYRQHMKVTEDTLSGLGAGGIPRIYVMNKADLVLDAEKIPRVKENEIWMSAKSGIGMRELIDMITSRVYSDLKTLEILLPFSRGDLVNKLHVKADVASEDYEAEGIRMKVKCPAALAGEVEKYTV